MVLGGGRQTLCTSTCIAFVASKPGSGGAPGSEKLSTLFELMPIFLLIPGGGGGGGGGVGELMR